MSVWKQKLNINKYFNFNFIGLTQLEKKTPFFILELHSQCPQPFTTKSSRCRVIRTGTRAVPHQVAVAPLIILSPIVTHCNSPAHDWWCRCLITPRQKTPKITFHSSGQLQEFHEVCWKDDGPGAVQPCWASVNDTSGFYKLWTRISTLL